MKKQFFVISFIILGAIAVGAYFIPSLLWAYAFFGPLFIVGVRDLIQTKHSVTRNFPVIGHFRYMMETIRPEINQYFVESNSDGVPFSREQRSIVYQRGKKQLDTLPFGTQKNVYEVGYEWVNHSLSPVHVDPKSLRIMVGGPQCKQPYSALSSTVGSEAWNSRDLKSRPH